MKREHTSAPRAGFVKREHTSAPRAGFVKREHKSELGFCET